MRNFHHMLCAGLMLVLPLSASAAAEFPAPQSGDWIAKDFQFHTGEVMPALKLHYTTVGNPKGMPVLILHGTMGSGAGFLSPGFGGELFGPGQVLDAAKYFIILPDAIGAGRSSKPSDGLKTKFPHYNYDDMVTAQYRLVTEGLGVRHLRLVMGNSMGGMHAWLWGTKYPAMMDALAPMASQPSAMSGRNWMLRRMLVESIKADPNYRNGDYTGPLASMRLADTFYGLATSGGTQALQAQAPTSAEADAIIDRRLAAPSRADANDTIYQWESSRGYDATPGLARITMPVLAVNSADDERNPPETGLMARDMAQLKQGRLLLIPAGTQTRGHGTTGNPNFWKEDLGKFLAALP